MSTALNLLPWRARKRQRRWRHSLLALALSLFAGGMAWWWLDTDANTKLHNQRQHQQALMQQLTKLDTRIAAFEHHTQQQHTQTIAHAQLERKRLSFIHLLDTLARHLPNGVVLTNVQQQGDTLTLSARAASNAQLTQTIQQWPSAALSTITSERAGHHTFTLSIPWPTTGTEQPTQFAQMEATP